MADDLRVNSWLVIPAGELRERFSRSSGPGGQSVNTTDSRVELSFDVLRSPTLPERERDRALARLETRLADGVITVAAEGERSQLMNREAARARLAALLREATAPPPPPRVADQADQGLAGAPPGRQAPPRADQAQPPLRNRRRLAPLGQRPGRLPPSPAASFGSSVSETELMHSARRSACRTPRR